MWRKIGDAKRTATIHNGVVTVMFDDGWENLLDCRQTFSNDIAAATWLQMGDWEESDPNADLKAKGFVWNGHYYAKPEVKNG
jgi:hypothetical protein